MEYAFNLVLLPVHFAGVLKSLQQAATCRKIPDARSPKVTNRTADRRSLDIHFPEEKRVPATRAADEGET